MCLSLVAGLNSSCGALQQCTLYSFPSWAHRCGSALGQWSYLWHLSKILGYWKTNIHKFEPIDISNHIILDNFIKVWWSHKRGCYRVSDQPCAISPYPFHAFFICPCYISWKGVPWAIVNSWDHKCCLWACKHDG